jgi:hypothetical protein
MLNEKHGHSGGIYCKGKTGGGVAKEGGNTTHQNVFARNEIQGGRGCLSVHTFHHRNYY